MHGRHWLALCLVSVGACVKAPPVQTPELPVQTPDVFTTGDDLAEVVPSDWWTSFGDQRLDIIVEEALANNYDLAAAAARLDQAAADAKIAGADLFPQIGLNFTGARRKQNFIGFPIPGSDSRVLSSTATNMGVNIETSWEVDLWGRIRAETRASIAGFQATAAELDAAKLSIAGQTAKAWFAAAEATEQLRLAEATLESFRGSTDQVRQRYEVGVRPSLDYRLSLANLNAAEANLETRLRQLDLARRQLELLIGRYPAAELQAASSLGATPPEIPAGIPAELVSRRPDLTAVERRLVASGELVSVAKAARYPRISLTASGGTATAALTDLLDGGFGVWSLAGALVQPLFQGGRITGNIARAEAAEREGLNGYVSAVLSAYFEVERALAAGAFLERQESALGEASRHSRAAEALADERYRTGLEGYVTVLEAQRRSFDAESAHISVRRLRIDNRIDLFLALGGGFDRKTHPELAAETPNSEAESHR